MWTRSYSRTRPHGTWIFVHVDGRSLDVHGFDHEEVQRPGPRIESIGADAATSHRFGTVVEPDPDLRMRGQLRLSEGLHDITDVADDAMPRDDRRVRSA